MPQELHPEFTRNTPMRGSQQLRFNVRILIEDAKKTGLDLNRLVSELEKDERLYLYHPYLAGTTSTDMVYTRLDNPTQDLLNRLIKAHGHKKGEFKLAALKPNKFEAHVIPPAEPTVEQSD